VLAFAQKILREVPQMNYELWLWAFLSDQFERTVRDKITRRDNSVLKHLDKSLKSDAYQDAVRFANTEQGLKVKSETFKALSFYP
jgi:hypothetical protein